MGPIKRKSILPPFSVYAYGPPLRKKPAARTYKLTARPPVDPTFRPLSRSPSLTRSGPGSSSSPRSDLNSSPRSLTEEDDRAQGDHLAHALPPRVQALPPCPSVPLPLPRHPVPVPQCFADTVTATPALGTHVRASISARRDSSWCGLPLRLRGYPPSHTPPPAPCRQRTHRPAVGRHVYVGRQCGVCARGDKWDGVCARPERPSGDSAVDALHGAACLDVGEPIQLLIARACPGRARPGRFGPFRVDSADHYDLGDRSLPARFQHAYLMVLSKHAGCISHLLGSTCFEWLLITFPIPQREQIERGAGLGEFLLHLRGCPPPALREIRVTACMRLRRACGASRGGSVGAGHQADEQDRSRVAILA
ncbi:hypothetical protein C8F04DRAFT_1189174 [Mycena alexandri]|uniref:Uncharacterized protein n=1 Tax=Mycena alexandri TaxID=1745969 RepID=A0AAD6SHW2_9AGAR|nr:hypothetical protein C8F04DRAFT_1189174 [Mycena alexandri]